MQINVKGLLRGSLSVNTAPLPTQQGCTRLLAAHPLHWPLHPKCITSLIPRMLFSFVGKIQSSCALQGMIRHVIPCRNNNPDRTTTHEPELFNGNQVRIELFMYNVINFIVSGHYYCNIQHRSSTKIVLNSHSVLDRQE